MKKATIISAVITVLLLLSAMICGLWLRAGNPGSFDFHVHCGMAAVAFSVITLCLAIVTFSQLRKG